MFPFVCLTFSLLICLTVSQFFYLSRTWQIDTQKYVQALQKFQIATTVDHEDYSEKQRGELDCAWEREVEEAKALISSVE